MKKVLLTSLIVIILGTAGYAGFKYFTAYRPADVPAATSIDDLTTSLPFLKESQQTNQTDTAPTSSKSASPSAIENFSAKALPEELNLAMPFYPQAPFADWSLPWQEACEEASVLLIADVYFDHNWSREEFRDQILDLVEWEKEKFGDYKHTDAYQTEQILNEYLQLKTKLVENPTLEDLKNILNRGHLIVVFVAGKKVGNPFYKNGGPNYHALVIKGYTKDQKIITNDVGTKRGENYVYSWDIFQKAIHDYKEPIEAGTPRIIEVIPPVKQ